ncbi:aliphatic sulfonate ABC transporter substrate-binding protein [Alkalihalobacillus oceani]|uniref:Putative aliphatic sulfonates-binding protein n=1 Tax=Halalkalibacter oceani TaxID=1653776 RepID=A0A9X2DUN1_9BACI|nr:aliphatic sulfonate ABC transporter substrate-binding protein [Halalkalibacter oceani]MCM3715842.1 aliphatic sulfonate ABC transporter substrate-binding protein [Halalkalibacter oceani]
MRTNKRSIFFFMIIVTALWLTACGAKETDSVSEAAPGHPEEDTAGGDPDVFKVGFQKGDNLTILKASGELEKALEPRGIEVEWVEFSVGPPLLEALNVGEIHFGYTGTSPPVFAQSGDGPDVAYVGYAPSSQEGYGIITQHDSPLSSLKELKGKKVAAARGSAGHYFLIKALESVGLTLDDIEATYLAYSEGRTAFERKDIDAWVVPDPRFADAEITIQAKPLATRSDVPAQYNFYLAYRPFANEHSDILRIAIDELAKAEDRAQADLQATAELLFQDTGVAVNIWERSLSRQAWGSAYPLTEEVIQAQQEVADTFYQTGEVPREIDVTEAMINIEE